MERRNRTGHRRLRAGLVTVAAAVSMLAAAGGGVAQAGVSRPGADGPSVGTAASQTCGKWFPATQLGYSSNHLVGVYLQERRCEDGRHFIVAVHNESDNALGNRAFGLNLCLSPGGTVTRNRVVTPWGAYIPAHDSWASPEVNAQDLYVAGVIFQPRTSTGEDFVVDGYSACV
jgi:hypothetical protein